MSPRRMDISSLLRDPSPPIDGTHRPQNPPSSLLAILNATDAPCRSPPRPPFLGLDALVHAAAEERRRITAVSAASIEFAHDHDRPSRHYSYPSVYPPPSHRPQDAPPSFQDTFRPLKRPRDTVPPEHPCSSSPEPSFPLRPTSPSTRFHPSASPSTSYPTLRQQPLLHMDPTRPTPAPLVGPLNSPSVSVHHTTSFLHSPHPLHSSPRNISPHRQSPQHFRSQHHSSPVQTTPLIPASTETDDTSPRYGYGPRMAGGIQVLSNDSSSSVRPDFSTYHTPRRDLSTEHLPSEPQADYTKHEPLKLSPLSVRAFSFDDERQQIKALSHNVESQETAFPRGRVRTRPPAVDLMGDGSNMPVKATDSPIQHYTERHPIRVWEEPSTVSPTRHPCIALDPTEEHIWSGPSESGHGERFAKEDRITVLQQDTEERLAASPCSRPQSSRLPAQEPSASLQTLVKEIRPDLRPSLPFPTHSQSRTRSAHTSLPYSSSLCLPTTSIPDLEAQSTLQPERSEMQVDTNPDLLHTSPDPIAAEPTALDSKKLIPTISDASLDGTSPTCRPSMELFQPVVAGDQGMPAHLIHPSFLESQSSVPSQQPSPILLPTKDEPNLLPAHIPVSPSPQPEPTSCQSSEPDRLPKREPPVSEQTMMDVEEELLSLVEDRPVHPAPVTSKTQTSRSPVPISGGQAVSLNVEQGLVEAPAGASTVPSSQLILKGLAAIDEEKDRASMPPPAARSKKVEQDKAALAATASTGNKKKKDGTSKPAAKLKPPPKPRVKPPPKPKAKPTVVTAPSAKVAIPKGVVNVNVRSRSTSTIPGAVDDVVPEAEVDQSDKEDDKLYCVCKTRYDEDRMMIACDRCDEWFHTVCVNMPDLEIDLVDQFICPPCIRKHPHLRTTWKRRCLFGLQHENPSSSEACHKPSRGTFSKYCSDDCGIKYMQARIVKWEKSGGARDLLWESVKNAPKREGVVVCVDMNGTGVHSDNSEPEAIDSAAKRRIEREVAYLNARLEEVVKEREFMKRELDMVMWRKKVVQLASERAGKVDECGWDQRLCFGEEEWTDFGSEVVESYEEERVKVESGEDAMALDTTSTAHGEWWCTGKKKCERHAGWQKLRVAEVSFDMETKEGILLKLTTREREIRKSIEDMLYPQPTGTLQASANPEVRLNGIEKPPERGKKRTS